MAMMKSNLNAFLMFLIIVMLAGLIGVSLYFQHAMKAVNEKYNLKSAELEETQSNLLSYTGQLRRINSSLLNTTSNMQSYTIEFQSVYGTCKNEKDALSQDLNRTKQDLKGRMAELKELKAGNSFAASRLMASQTLSTSISGDITEIGTLASSIRSKAASNMDKNLTSAECRSVLSSISKSANELKTSADSADSASETLNTNLGNMKTKIDEMSAILRKY